MAASTESEAALKERFYRQFQNEVNGTMPAIHRVRNTSAKRLSALQKQIESLDSNNAPGADRNAAIEDCLAGIDRLSHEVKDASNYLPAYDRRTYSNVRYPIHRVCDFKMALTNDNKSIKTLSDKLERSRKEMASPKKFKFKSARINQATTLTAPSQDAERKSPSNVESTSQQTPSAQSIPKEEQNPTISNQTRAYHRLSPTSAKSSQTITNITNSIILPPAV